MSNARPIVTNDHQMVSDAIQSLLETEYDVVGKFSAAESFARTGEALPLDGMARYEYVGGLKG